MKEKRHVMKLVLAGFGILTAILLWSDALQAVSINWGTAGNPLYDESGVGVEKLKRGDIVQLICDRGRDGVDPPGSNGMPLDDDELLHASQIGYGSFFEGEFSDNITTSSVGIGDILYVRAWNDSTLSSAGRWGDTRQHDPQEWVVDNNMVFTLNATENGSWATTSYKLRVLSRDYEAMLMGAERDREMAIQWEGGRVHLLSPRPNPFRDSAVLRFRVAGVSPHTPLCFQIFDIKGCLVRRFSLHVQVEGEDEIIWDGRDDSGRSVGSGTYLCRLQLAEGGSGSVLALKLVRVE